MGFCMVKMKLPFDTRRGGATTASALDRLLAEIRDCRHCSPALPLGPRPVVQAAESSRLLIIGQAPGRIVHETAIAWNDPSGERLRNWIGVDRSRFYDPAQVALVGMGFCYPGRAGNGGDAPPRPECAPLWHEQLFRHLVGVRLTLLVGSYAHAAYLRSRSGTLADRVRVYASFPKGLFALPHPSWRNNGWLARNPWFVKETLPALRVQVQTALDGDSDNR